MNDKLGFRVLQAVDAGMTSVVGLAVALDSDVPSVRGAVDTLVAGGLLSFRDGSDDEVALTEAGAKVINTPGGMQVETGRFGSTTVTSFRFSTGRSTPGDEWADAGRLVSEAWTTAQAARKTESSRRRGRLRVGDVERDAALESLHHAFGDGRLSQEELDTRTDTALRATTRAELDSVLHDLATEQRPRSGHGGLQRTLAGVLAILCVPVLLLGALIATARHSQDNWVGVLILLAVVPVMGASAWWAFRGGPHHET